MVSTSVIAIIVVVIIVIAAGGFYVSKSSKPEATMDSPAATMAAPAASAPAATMDAPAASAPAATMDAPAPSAPATSTDPSKPVTYEAGYITSHPDVGGAGRGSVAISSVEATLKSLAAFLKSKNATVKYNYVSIYDDGGFRLYDIPAGVTPVYGPDPNRMAVNTFYVPGGISVSTFGSISHFGKSGMSMTMILVILLLAGGAYYLHSQGKLKMPTFNQRMAQFGRTIKSLRKM